MSTERNPHIVDRFTDARTCVRGLVLALACLMAAACGDDKSQLDKGTSSRQVNKALEKLPKPLNKLIEEEKSNDLVKDGVSKSLQSRALLKNSVGGLECCQGNNHRISITVEPEKPIIESKFLGTAPVRRERFGARTKVDVDIDVDNDQPDLSRQVEISTPARVITLERDRVGGGFVPVKDFEFIQLTTKQQIFNDSETCEDHDDHTGKIVDISPKEVEMIEAALRKDPDIGGGSRIKIRIDSYVVVQVCADRVVRRYRRFIEAKLTTANNSFVLQLP